MHSSRTLVAAVALSAITVFAGAGSAVAAPAVGSVDFGSSSGSGSGTGSASGSESGSVDFGSGGPDVEHPVSTCFWSVPINPERADPQLNYAFPDTAAIYWAAQFTIPENAELVIRGQYAHARYQSLNSYNAATAMPTAVLNDISTAPDAGSRNTYLPGADRSNESARSYTASVLNEASPAEPKPNTLYAGVPGQDRISLLYRIYLPDTGRDLTGGVGLPEPELHLPGGQVLRGQDLCSAVGADNGILKPASLPLDTYKALRDQPGKPATFPSEQAPVWRAYYSAEFTLGCTYLGKCDGTPQRVGGQYSNIDNSYVTAEVNRGFGEVLVLRGELPRTPKTTGGAKNLDSAVDMRFWSMCSNESLATTKVATCLFDEQMATDADGRYTIVASLPEDRPANATKECGVSWLSLSPAGDGAGHPDDSLLIMRNMLPAKDFSHAAHDTKTPGDEKAVMGEYLPDGQYTSKLAFEGSGCAK